MNAQTSQPSAGESAQNSDGFRVILRDGRTGVEVWRGTFAQLLRDNTFAPAEVKNAAAVLVRHGVWAFGGGAAPVYTVERETIRPQFKRLYVDRPFAEPGVYISDEHTALVAKLYEGQEHYAPLFAASTETLAAIDSVLACIDRPGGTIRSITPAAISLLRDARTKAGGSKQ